MHTTSPAPESLVEIATLKVILQRSRASIYRDIKNETFPKPPKLRSSSGWKFSEVMQFINRISDDRVED